MESPLKPAPRECDRCPSGNTNLEYQWPHVDRPYAAPHLPMPGSCWKCRNPRCRNHAQLVFIPDVEMT
jgi:hypothetical protein